MQCIVHIQYTNTIIGKTYMNPKRGWISIKKSWHLLFQDCNFQVEYGSTSKCEKHKNIPKNKI